MKHVIELLNCEEILALAKLGCTINMIKTDSSDPVGNNYTVKFKSDIQLLVICDSAGNVVDSLCDSAGEIIRHEFNNYDFHVDSLFSVYNVQMTNRNCIDKLLAYLRVQEAKSKADKRTAISNAKTLKAKIHINREYNLEIRRIQDRYDNVQLAFWHLVDVIERDVTVLDN